MRPRRFKASAIRTPSPARRSPPARFVSSRLLAVACIYSSSRNAYHWPKRSYSSNERGGVSTAIKHSFLGGGLANKSPARLSNRVVALRGTRNFTKFEPRAGEWKSIHRGSASGPARSSVANSTLARQFPAGQCQRFVDGLGSNAWFGVRLLAAVSAGPLRSVLVVVGHSVLLQFGLVSVTREALSFPEVSREEAAALSLWSALTGSNTPASRAFCSA